MLLGPTCDPRAHCYHHRDKGKKRRELGEEHQMQDHLTVECVGGVAGGTSKSTFSQDHQISLRQSYLKYTYSYALLDFTA